MSTPIKFNALFSFPCALGSPPPTDQDFRRFRIFRLLAGCALLSALAILGAGVDALPMSLDWARNHPPSLPELALSMALIVFGTLSALLIPVLLLGALFKIGEPLGLAMCQPLVEACALHPSIEAYRAQVLAQNRPIFQEEAAMLLSEARRMDPRTLAACKALHGLPA